MQVLQLYLTNARLIKQLILQDYARIVIQLVKFVMEHPTNVIDAKLDIFWTACLVSAVELDVWLVQAKLLVHHAMLVMLTFMTMALETVYVIIDTS